MKKTCQGCKALEDSASLYCTLKYRTKIDLDAFGKGRDRLVPAEDCPKPLTLKKYVELYEQKP
jgi:hypothetical protein